MDQDLCKHLILWLQDGIRIANAESDPDPGELDKWGSGTRDL
jgi:hypothetical protein